CQRGNTATGQLALQTERECFALNCGRAERERECSAARSVQRMNARALAGQCRATTARFEATKIRRSRVPERKEERQKISRHRGPKFSFVHEQSPAGFCSIAPARFGVFGLPVWNETGRLLALNRFLSPPRRMRNGSRSQSTSRSQSQRPRSACSLSCLLQSSKRCQFSNIFLGINQGRDCSRSHAFGRHD